MTKEGEEEDDKGEEEEDKGEEEEDTGEEEEEGEEAKKMTKVKEQTKGSKRRVQVRLTFASISLQHELQQTAEDFEQKASE